MRESSFALSHRCDGGKSDEAIVKGYEDNDYSRRKTEFYEGGADY